MVARKEMESLEWDLHKGESPFIADWDYADAWKAGFSCSPRPHGPTRQAKSK